MIGQLHGTAAVDSEKQLLLSIELGAGCAAESLWTFWGRRQNLNLPRNTHTQEFIGFSSRSLVTIPAELSRLSCACTYVYLRACVCMYVCMYGCMYGNRLFLQTMAIFLMLEL